MTDLSVPGVVKMVFASYNQLKDFLGTTAFNHPGVLHNSSRIINSRVISASSGSFAGAKFSEPVTVILKLIQVIRFKYFSYLNLFITITST